MPDEEIESAAPALDEAPESPPSDSDEQAAPVDESERERELQRRLTQQGREAAEARRQATQAQQQAEFLRQNLNQLQSQVTLLTANMSEQQRLDAERKQAEQDAYLKTLPPEQRLDRKIEMLNDQIKEMRTAAAPSQPARQPAAVQAPPQPQPTQDDAEASLQYMKQRAIEIVNEAQSEFGVKVDVSQLPDADWESEDSFYRAVMRTAARTSTNGGGEVAQKKAPANETPEQMQKRIRREVEESLGVSSPRAPTAQTRRTTKPTADDVAAVVGTYDSAKGPKANLAKLKEMRERMNA